MVALNRQLLRPVRRHPDKALLIGLMHRGHLDAILSHLLHQLARVQLTIAPARLDDLALLLERKGLPREARPHVLLE